MIVDIYTDSKAYSSVCYDYWSIDNSKKFIFTVSDICKEHKIEYTALCKIVSKYSAVFLKSNPCLICNKMYKVKKRSEFKSYKPMKNWICDDCKIDLEFNKIAKFRNTLLNNYHSCAENKVNIDELGFRDLVFLLSMIRCFAAENFSCMHSYNSILSSRFSPCAKFDIEIITYLYREKLIAINPASSIYAFDISDDNNYKFDIKLVEWEFVYFYDMSSPSEIVDCIESKLRNNEICKKHHDEILSVVKEISLNECLGYLEYISKKHDLSFIPGKKTFLTLNRILDDLSVAQIYNIIWGATRDAAAFFMRGGVNRLHAANSIVGRIQRVFDRAQANDWAIKPFQRNYDLPQSVLSQVVFNTCLRTDDGGFSEPFWKLI